MSLIRWNPLREMDDMLERYNTAMDLPGRLNFDLFPKGDWAPRVDIMETDNAFILKMDLPEVDKKNVKISIEDGVLSIAGHREQEKEEKDKKYHLIERSYGSFQRSFSLPDNLNKANVKATFKDGILTVECPKTAEAKRKSIDIQIH
jgi:HSP20 family protein